MSYKPTFFSPREFLCKCGCGQGIEKMDPEFLELLDKLRSLYGRPIHLTSAYRCPSHNLAVSTTGEAGPHTTGRAVDIAVSRGEGWRLLTLALGLGFTGIGVNQKGPNRFIHLDNLIEPDHAPRPTVWSY